MFAVANSLNSGVTHTRPEFWLHDFLVTSVKFDKLLNPSEP